MNVDSTQRTLAISWIMVVLVTQKWMKTSGFVLYLILSCHLLCLSVKQERRPISPHLVSSSSYWTHPLSCGTSPCSTSKLLRYLCIICYFDLIRFKQGEPVFASIYQSDSRVAWACNYYSDYQIFKQRGLWSVTYMLQRLARIKTYRLLHHNDPFPVNEDRVAVNCHETAAWRN